MWKLSCSLVESLKNRAALLVVTGGKPGASLVGPPLAARPLRSLAEPRRRPAARAPPVSNTTQCAERRARRYSPDAVVLCCVGFICVVCAVLGWAVRCVWHTCINVAVMGVAWRGVAWCGAARRGVAWRDGRGVAWRGVVYSVACV